MNTRNEPQQKQQLKALEMTPRRKQFFRMVSEGLNVGFEGEDLSRVENFVRYCKGELEYKALGPLHQVGFCAGARMHSPENFRGWVRTRAL